MVMLRARGLRTFQHSFSEVPEGALILADNCVIDRDGVIQPRRGMNLYGDTLGVSSSNRAKQLLTYKNRVIRHYSTLLEYDDGSGTFTSFNGSYTEPETGLRMRGLEVNGNFYFTTNEGIKKISATSASELSSASGYITNAGGVKAIDIEGVMNYENAGFFTEKSKVAYRVVWGIRDANNNLILGSPSSRLVVTNTSTTLTGTVDLTINIPQDITVNHFYQIYRSAVKEAGVSDLDDIDAEDELYLVIEDFPDSTDISNGYVEESDITPEDFRASGTLLYTNPISGDGILAANEQPPLAKDIALFKNSTYYANTKTRHRQTVGLLSVSDFVSGTTKFVIANGTTTTVYTFRGAAEATEFTFDTVANTAEGSYFVLYSANDERKYVVWFNKGAGTEPAGADTTGAIFIEVDISADTTANDIAANVSATMNAADSGDFTYSGITSPLTVTCALNGNVTDAVAGAVAPGGAFAINVTTQGDGEDSATQEVLLSSNPSVAQAIDETARSLVRIINKQANEIVYAYYLSGADDIPGQILLEARTLSDTEFYVGVSGSADKWNPTLPVYGTITVISAANPSQITSAGHGLATGAEVVLGNTDSTPDIDGVYTVTVIDADNFTVPANLSGLVAGTSGIWFETDADSDNEVTPNRIYYSKVQQPEAVPIVNYIDIGPKDQPIKRILALRDSLIVLKTDGVYRVSTEEGIAPTVTLTDSSALITAPDSAAILNNQIYMHSTQGIVTVVDGQVQVISRDIEDQILEIASNAYTSFETASWAVGYESDRSYLFFTVEETTDTVATQCFRYNTFTRSWTRFTFAGTCGVIGGDDKLYTGATDTNYIEQERKNFNRKDYSDREVDVAIGTGSVIGTTGKVFKLGSVAGITEGDAIVQTLYVTISQFNRLLQKLDDDPELTDTDYYSTLYLSPGDNLTANFTALVAKLNADDTTEVYAFTGSTVFSTIQTEYNTMIAQLNASAGVFFSNYATSTGTVEYEALILDVNSNLNRITVDVEPDWIQGDLTVYKGISCSVQWAPQTMQDPSMLKHVREGTVLFEDNSFYGASVSYRSDLSRSFEEIPFLGFGVGVWGNFEWGYGNWGGDGAGIPMRTLIPQQKQRCRYIDCLFEHKNARQKFSLYGISLTYKPTSSRGYR